MKRFMILAATLLGLSGCVSDYPGYDPYYGPDVYAPRPVVVYEDRYRPRPIYRDYYRDRPYYRDRAYRDRPYRPGPDRRLRDYDRPRDRPYDGPRPVRGPDRYDRPAPPPPVVRADRGIRTGQQPGIDAGRAFGGRAVAAPPQRGPRPYIPPRPAGAADGT
ncbi:hypothetical protein [Aureimonas sp. ME7]|uniref:hypothetical protein n=1 Tax=Aureimonas sp. ME7 TaxID=2744252 RepID=UPI0015F7748B|nr:hypothetical protein [Aureimonas sp. ME7]